MMDKKELKNKLKKLIKDISQAGSTRYMLLKDNKKDTHIDNSSVRNFDKVIEFFSENHIKFKK